MARWIFIAVVGIMLMSGLESYAGAGVPNTGTSYVEMAWTGPSSPVLLNLPNGGGNPFFEAFTLDHGVVDATLTLYLIDELGFPVTGYAAEDIWLMTTHTSGGLAPCFDGLIHGTIPYSPTHPNDGVFTWVDPLHAGGWSERPTVVIINGVGLLEDDLNLRHNSPDIDGNGIVDLSDLAEFAYDFYSINYSFRSDFFYDGQVNLSDVVPIAANILNACIPQ